MQYLEIADSISDSIREGAYEVGGDLPPISTLCEQHECAPTTMRNALQTLADEGVILTRQGKRARVVRIPARPIGPVVDRFLVRRPASAADSAAVPNVLNRVTAALDVAIDYRDTASIVDEKDWVIDAMTRALTGDEYSTFVDVAREGLGGWKTGAEPEAKGPSRGRWRR